MAFSFDILIISRTAYFMDKSTKPFLAGFLCAAGFSKLFINSVIIIITG
jgi:hypothetical protein